MKCGRREFIDEDPGCVKTLRVSRDLRSTQRTALGVCTSSTLPTLTLTILSG